MEDDRGKIIRSAIIAVCILISICFAVAVVKVFSKPVPQKPTSSEQEIYQGGDPNSEELSEEDKEILNLTELVGKELEGTGTELLIDKDFMTEGDNWRDVMKEAFNYGYESSSHFTVTRLYNDNHILNGFRVANYYSGDGQ